MSTQFHLYIPRALADAMMAQAVSELPNECCGLLAGTIDREAGAARASERYPLINRAASPFEYEADPRGLFAASRDQRQRGLELLAIYHSHPTSDPVPSRTDLARAFYPEVIYLIVSLNEPTARMRGWWLSENAYSEATWELV